jgi:rhodanese-related sulfurtransferase
VPDTIAPDPSRNAPRLSAADAYDAQRAGALLVDIRPARLRVTNGEIPGSLVVAGPLRDWRLDDDSAARVCDIADGRVVLVVGDGGAVSLLAVSALRGLGVRGAVDLEHGFSAWAAAGFPVQPGLTGPGRRAPEVAAVLVA